VQSKQKQNKGSSGSSVGNPFDGQLNRVSDRIVREFYVSAFRGGGPWRARRGRGDPGPGCRPLVAKSAKDFCMAKSVRV
jgi:hypothetical protein